MVAIVFGAAVSDHEKISSVVGAEVIGLVVAIADVGAKVVGSSVVTMGVVEVDANVGKS